MAGSLCIRPTFLPPSLHRPNHRAASSPSMGRSFFPALSLFIVATSSSHSIPYSHLVSVPRCFRRFFSPVSSVLWQRPLILHQPRPFVDIMYSRVLASRILRSCFVIHSSANISYFGAAFSRYWHHMINHPFSTTATNEACEGQENKEKISVTFVGKDAEEKTKKDDLLCLA